MTKIALQFTALFCCLGSFPMTVIATVENRPFCYVIAIAMLFIAWICFKSSKQVEE